MHVVFNVDAGVVIAPRLRSRLHREVERMLKAATLRDHRAKLQFVVRLCIDAESRELNRARRGIDAPAGVIVLRDRTDATCLGELVISFETANRNAKAKMQSLHTELLLLASTGICALLGTDDDVDSEALRGRASALRYEALRPGHVKPA